MKFIKTQYGSLINVNYIRCIFPEDEAKIHSIKAELDNGDQYVLADFNPHDDPNWEEHIAKSIDNLHTELNEEETQ